VKIVLAPVGTRGDVQPLLALGIRLNERGHEVTTCAPENYARWIGEIGLAFTHLRPAAVNSIERRPASFPFSPPGRRCP
jgi:vancomycin aglycone glucosyltransferase